MQKATHKLMDMVCICIIQNFCVKELCSREALHSVKSAEEVSGIATP